MSENLLSEQVFAETIAMNGGRLYRVGGCVRDTLRGVTPKDIDYCIVGMVKKKFKQLFPAALECGGDFPVFRLPIDGVRSEVAFARTERKEGSGYKGFKVQSNPKITIVQDLLRRDTTVNSIAIDSITGEVIDPVHGLQDVKDGILRATGKHFPEDPIRAIRLASQAACLGFTVDNDTLALAASTASELANEPVERIFSEFAKVLTEAWEPARFFKVLAETHLLQITFAQMSELRADELVRAMAKLDLVAKATEKPKLRFATLGLVLSKEQLTRWNSRVTLPGDWLESAVTIDRTVKLLANITPETIVDAINGLRRGSMSVEEFDCISKAVGLTLPALKPLKASMAVPPDEAIPEKLKGKELGEWLRHKQIEAVKQSTCKSNR